METDVLPDEFKKEELIYLLSRERGWIEQGALISDQTFHRWRQEAKVEGKGEGGKYSREECEKLVKVAHYYRDKRRRQRWRPERRSDQG